MPNWELKSCCKHDHVVFLATIGVFTVVILALWRTILLTPFKLVTVFLHEASHAIACILTYGKVEGIQVHAYKGGVTQTRGGIYWLILPAGFHETSRLCVLALNMASDAKILVLMVSYFFLPPDLGSSFWGMALILASTNLLTARIAAGCFGVALLVVLLVAKNWTLRGLCIGEYLRMRAIRLSFILFTYFHTLPILADESFRIYCIPCYEWVLQEFTKVRVLRYVILFIGVMNSLFSVYDIYDDLTSIRVNSSDAEKFAEVCPCPCNGVGWGVIWGLISFIFLSASVYLGLVILS